MREEVGTVSAETFGNEHQVSAEADDLREVPADPTRRRLVAEIVVSSSDPTRFESPEISLKLNLI